MQAAADRYRKFWAEKTSPMSRCNSAESLHILGEEINLLLGNRKPRSVLEIGCGTGCLFDFLGFSPRLYRGVDFGPKMIEVFRHNHPELDLIETEGSSYRDDRKYDLILAHDVISHFSFSMLSEQCRNARSMMHRESLLIWASIPWRILQSSYDAGLWSNSGEASLVRWAKSKLHRIAGRDLLGRWYTLREISGLARKNSLRARFHGSITHPYRFHAVLSPEIA